ncbi:MAG: SMC family ATPase [Firmicutes bacterium]|jgi:exonuclease SbcC|nr:SMC family ATPase [Bacillota bacterium]
MRPIRLTMTAFGPYGGRQNLDFRELRDRSFLLIHGPTGSGKTTILDAICFALYGSASGSERDARQMRSHHAPPDLVTEVALDFSVGPEVYRVWRSPDQEVEKRRGQGVSRRKAEAALWRRTGVTDPGDAGVVLATGPRDVTLRIQEILGFRDDQFRQVVLLPQGEFRRVLSSGSKDRQEILEILFRTEIYRAMENSLKEAVAELRRERDALAEKRQWQLSEAGAADCEEIERRLADDLDREREAIARVGKAKAALASARDALTEAARVRDRVDELESARRELDALATTGPEIEARRAELVRARKAESLGDAEAALAARTREAEQTRALAEDCRARLDRALEALGLAESRLDVEKSPQRQKEREDARDEVMRLRELAPRVEAIDRARGAVIEARERAFSAGECAEAARRELDRLTAEARQMRAEQGMAQAEAACEAKWAAEVERVERLIGRINELVFLRGELARREQAASDARNRAAHAEAAHTRAREELARLREAWVRGQAARLAAQLIPGEPCPVCGSREHPVPAQAGEGMPTERTMKNAEEAEAGLDRAFRQAQADAGRAAAEEAAARGSVSQILSGLGRDSEITPEAASAAFTAARRNLEAARSAAEKAERLAGELARCEHERQRVESELGERESARSRALAELAAAEASLAEREQNVPPNLRAPDALEAALKSAVSTLESLESAARLAEEEAGRARQEVASAQASLDAALRAARAAASALEADRAEFAARLIRAGFSGPEEYQAARRPLEVISELESRVTEYDQMVHAAQERLTRAEAAARGLAEPDMASLEEAFVRAQAETDAAVAERARLGSQVARERQWLESLRRIERNFSELEAKYAVAGRVAEVACGANEYGLTFERFVLGAMLDDVTSAATERLRVMSRGRYQLRRTMDRARRNSPGGLELEVLDSFTGTERSVSTLSGGEGFLASLALALGLADVVQAYSGGIRLDTIFVDEGFGSLDPESLDLALAALMDLQKGSGRLVGIISHVPELKERIDARLEVTTTEKGSIARFRVS